MRTVQVKEKNVERRMQSQERLVNVGKKKNNNVFTVVGGRDGKITTKGEKKDVFECLVLFFVLFHPGGKPMFMPDNFF